MILSNVISHLKDNLNATKDLLYNVNSIYTVSENLVNKWKLGYEDSTGNSSRIFLIGNGGSAATANHIRCDFEKGLFISTRQYLNLNVISLTDNPYLLTAYINDYSPEDVFTNMLIPYKVTSNDIVILISGSGTSRNIINVLKYFKQHNLNPYIIGLTSKINSNPFDVDIEKYVYCADTTNMQVAENIHLMFLHTVFTCVADICNNKNTGVKI